MGRVKGRDKQAAADGLRFHARDRVWRQCKRNVSQRTACGAAINEMAADEPRSYARDHVRRQNEQNVVQRVACGAETNQKAADGSRAALGYQTSGLPLIPLRLSTRFSNRSALKSCWAGLYGRTPLAMMNWLQKIIS